MSDRYLIDVDPKDFAIWLNITVKVDLLDVYSGHCYCKWVSSLTHWGRDKMTDISQTTFSNGFSWMKIYGFRLRFHWSLFLRFELTIFQHWSSIAISWICLKTVTQKLHTCMQLWVCDLSRNCSELSPIVVVRNNLPHVATVDAGGQSCWKSVSSEIRYINVKLHYE